jgi:long-chain acyl-CoA synthetase
MQYHNERPVKNLGNLPKMLASRYGEKMALDGPERTQSFNELESRANRVANMLVKRGLESEQRVGMYVPNTLQFPESFFGIVKAGGVPVPLNLRLDPKTLEYVLNDSGASYLIASNSIGLNSETVLTASNLAERADIEELMISGIDAEDEISYDRAVANASDNFETVDSTPDDVCLQLYTSGTTGKPKGVHTTHKNLLSSDESYARSALPLGSDDRALCVMPFFHIFGLHGILNTVLYSGGSVIVRQNPNGEELLKTVEEHGLTLMYGVPAIYNSMYQAYRDAPGDYDVSSLRYAMAAGAPLTAATRRDIEQGWNVRMFEGWGMTETTATGALTPPMGVRKEASCVGPMMPFIEMKLVDPETREDIVPLEDIVPFPSEELDFSDEEEVTGEIAIRGPPVFKGYHNRPELNNAVFDENGWFYTEDLARIDEDGFFWIVDRTDDMIIVGGENVYPTEVENSLTEHPAVIEAAVVSVPHKTKGQAPVAYVVLEEGEQISEEELRRFTLDYVATYAHPRRIIFIDELPRSGTQKVRRFKLEERIRNDIDGELSSSKRL